MADKFVSWLESAGKAVLSVAEKALGKVLPVAAEVAEEAEPIVDLALPLYGPIYNKVVGAVISTEQTYAASGQQNGTGAQKLSAVLQATEADLTPALNSAGLTGTAATTAATNYINGIVALLNGPVVAAAVNKATSSASAAATGSAAPAA